MSGLSNRAIRAAINEGKRVEIREGDARGAVRGLHVVVTKGGAATFYVRYRCEAGHRRLKLGGYPTLTIEQARKAARKRLAEVAEGEDPAGDRRAAREAPTLAEVAERWMAEHATPYLKPRTVAGYRSLLDLHVLPALGRRKVASITRADVERLHRKVGVGRRDRKDIDRRGGAQGAANRTVALLSTILNAAERYGDRPQRSNPCAGLKRFREQAKERFLTPDERARLEAAFSRAEQARKGEPAYVAPGAVAALRLLSLTGARSSEITTLTWSMVDLAAACLRLPDSKTGAKVVPLTRQAVALLERLHAQRDPDGELVVTGERGGPVHNIQRAWRSVCRAAELEGVRIHDLRHSAASDALNAGVPLALVGAMLGHRNTATTARYAHVADKALRDAAERMGDAIEASTRDGANVVRLRPVEQNHPKRSKRPESKRTRGRKG